MSAQVTHLRISRTGWLAIALVVLAPWSATLWLLRSARSTPPAATDRALPRASTPAPAAEANHVLQLKAGPWGELEATRITIEPPPEFIPTRYGEGEARWVFRQATPATVAQLWAKAGLNETQRRALEDPKRQEINGGTVVVRPDRDTVIGLSRESRAIIYGALTESPDNQPQREPFRFPIEFADEWLEGSNLPGDVLKLTQQLMYPRKSVQCFADYDVVLPLLDSDAERVRYLKTLSRKSALLVKLKVTPETNVDALASYWGKGRRSKDVRPLIQSLTQHPGGSSVDIVHLVPVFARSLLYTYPLPSENPTDRMHDCHWSSFNFFNERPDERFSDINFVRQTLLNDYYPVGGEPALGDVIILLQPDGVVIHSCVYIADDIVFTKNGPNFSVPWLLGRLTNVVAFYSVGSQPIEVRRYRAKRI